MSCDHRLPDAAFLHRLADAAAVTALAHYRKTIDIDEKPGHCFDPVTAADRETERILRDIIRIEFPEHAILGEEFGEDGGGEVKWVIDPIDGTRPFLLGIPVWGTLIGLTVGGRACMGMMSQPFIGERFWTTRDGSWTKGPAGHMQLRTRRANCLDEAILHINSPEPAVGSNRFDVPALQSRVRMTRYGGECYALAMLAAGRIDLCFEPALQPHDIVALVPIIEKAGGVITCLDGSRPEKGGAVLASANSELHEAAKSFLVA